MALTVAILFKLTLAALAAVAWVNWRRKARGEAPVLRRLGPALAGGAMAEAALILLALFLAPGGGA